MNSSLPIISLKYALVSPPFSPFSNLGKKMLLVLVSLFHFLIYVSNTVNSHRKLADLITWTTALSNSMKLSPAMWSQDRRVTVERSVECGPLEKGMANHFSILALRTP